LSRSSGPLAFRLLKMDVQPAKLIPRPWVGNVVLFLEESAGSFFELPPNARHLGSDASSDASSWEQV